MDKHAQKWTTLVPQRQLVGKSGRPLLSVLAARTSSASLIGKLPENAYVCLFYHLALSDIASLARCCRKTAALAADERVWKRKLAVLDWKGEQPPAAQKILDKQKQTRRNSAIPAATVAGLSSAARGVKEKRASAVLTSGPSTSSILKPSASAAALQPLELTNPPVASTSQLAEIDDDGFGDFIDFSSNSNDRRHSTASSAGNAAGAKDIFASIDLNAEPLAPSKPNGSLAKQKEEEDLLMLFDDGDDMGLATATPQRPTATVPSSTPQSSQPSGLARRTSVQQSRVNGSSGSYAASPTLARDLFVAYLQTLMPYYVSLQYQSTSSLVFSQPSLSNIARAHILSNLTRLMQPSICPTQYATKRTTVNQNLQGSIDYFEASMLAAFEKATDARIQREMREAAHASYALNGGVSVIQIFINKISLFNDQSWDPLRNLTKNYDTNGQMVDGIDFSAMDDFMDHVLAVVQKEGTVIARVFPKDSDALVYFADRIANDVISDYIIDLLSAAHDLTNPLFLLTTAATFGQLQRLIDTVLAIEPKSAAVTHSAISDIVYKLFEEHTTDYLKEEPEWCRSYLEDICTSWDRKLAEERASRDPTFLNAANPQQVKRNVLAGFTKALLLPVTIVPKTVAFSVNAITQGGTMAFNAMSGNYGASANAAQQKAIAAPGRPNLTRAGESNSTPGTPSTASSTAFEGLQGESFQSLISMETAMQLIQADRECLKRAQAFTGYPGNVGSRVKRVIEEIFIVLCQTISSSHLTPAFNKATQQMGLYKPADHPVDESVAPLVQFFELVHIGDTILQMVQVYYDRELAKYVDKNDFLSNIVREKKKFENRLDESVASGLNAGVNILMTQAEYILQSQQDPTDFCPELRDSERDKGQISIRQSKDVVVDFEGPTKAAEAVVDCLRSHCQMLKGSTDKAILEVFHQEVGLRLHGMLLKHFKKSIVSISGGFQVIADLNLYTSFVSSLKLPGVNPYFTALKMAANVFIIDSPRDLGMMARDLDRYEGTLRIEDVMEMVQCRTDWKKIEREVEKEVFGFKTEDCIIA